MTCRPSRDCRASNPVIYGTCSKRISLVSTSKFVLIIIANPRYHLWNCDIECMKSTWPKPQKVTIIIIRASYSYSWQRKVGPSTLDRSIAQLTLFNGRWLRQLPQIYVRSQLYACFPFDWSYLYFA